MIDTSYIRNSLRIQYKNAQRFVRSFVEFITNKRVINDPGNTGYWEKVRLYQCRRLPRYSRTKFLLLYYIVHCALGGVSKTRFDGA